MGNQDEEHLRLLSIFHYIAGGILALFGCFPIIHLIIGLVALFGGLASEEAPPAMFGLIFVGVALTIMLSFWTLAICVIIAGRSLSSTILFLFCCSVHKLYVYAHWHCSRYIYNNCSI